ncbi:MAG: hypothetical protein R6V60_15490, partial [Desulfobacterales bacterium]
WRKTDGIGTDDVGFFFAGALTGSLAALEDFSRQCKLSLGCEPGAIERGAGEFAYHLIREPSSVFVGHDTEGLTRNAEHRIADRDLNDRFAKTRHAATHIADASGEAFALLVHLDCNTTEVQCQIIGVLNSNLDQHSQLQALTFIQEALYLRI